MIKKLLDIDVRGITYKICLLSDKKYKKLHPDTEACMLVDEREIHFNERYHELTTIKHEIAHAFIKSCFLDLIDEVSISDFEEVVCEVISHFDYKMIEISENIQKEIKKAIKEEKKGKNDKTKK